MTPDPTRVFGVRVAGVALVLPPGEALEYVAAAPVFALPGAGRRVLGLAQLRGHPFVVLDAGAAPSRLQRAGERRSVLLIGGFADGGALCVDAPPEQLAPGEAVADAVRPDCAFADVLGEALACDGAEPGVWWRFDPARLFAALAEH